MLSRIIDRFVEWWLSRCPHDGAHVLADLLEGAGDRVVKYCRRCGAVRFSLWDGGLSEWRRPHPTWYPVRRALPRKPDPRCIDCGETSGELIAHPERKRCLACRAGSTDPERCAEHVLAEQQQRCGKGA